MPSSFENDTVLYHSDYFLAISNVLVKLRHQPLMEQTELKDLFVQAEEHLRQDSFDKNQRMQEELALNIERNLKKHGARTFGSLCQYRYINEHSRNQIRFVLNKMIKNGRLQTTAEQVLTEEWCPRHTKFWIEGYTKRTKTPCSPPEIL